MIKSARGGELDKVVTITNCEYSFTDDYSVNVHAHKGSAAALKLIIGNEVTSLYTMPFPETIDCVPETHPGPFTVPLEKEWSLVWVLESTRGKGRIIDAVEMNSGTCNP